MWMKNRLHVRMLIIGRPSDFLVSPETALSFYIVSVSYFCHMSHPYQIPPRHPFHTARKRRKSRRCGITYTAHSLRECPLDRIPSSHPFHTAQNVPNNGRCGSACTVQPPAKRPTAGHFAWNLLSIHLTTSVLHNLHYAESPWIRAFWRVFWEGLYICEIAIPWISVRCVRGRMQSPPCQTEASTAAAYLSLNPRKLCALPAGVFPQVYRSICMNALEHRWLQGLGRFTCEGMWKTHHGERAFWGTFAAARFPQVYLVICRNSL